MAHPTDYPAQKDISKLRLSSNRNLGVETYHGSHAQILVYNFLRANPNWAIDSLVKYLLHTYKEFGVTREIISDQIKLYIMTREEN